MLEKGDARDHSGLTRQSWVDAQLPPALARWPGAQHSVDAIHVEELGLHRARDWEIFTAAREAERTIVVLTKDDDFRKLLGQHGQPPQVVWIRCGNVTNLELRRIVHAAWPRAAELLAVGEPLVEIRRRRHGPSHP